MNQSIRIAACLAAALASSACSTKPRQFSAAVRPIDPALAQQRGETADFATCDKMVRGGRSNGFAAAAATGAFGSAAALGGAVVVGTSGLVGGGMGAAGAAAAAAMPVIGIAAAFGMNRLIRSGKERKYKRLMGVCMHEFGYEVAEWAKAPKKQQGTATLALAAQPASEPPPDVASPAVEAPLHTATPVDPAPVDPASVPPATQ